MRENLIEMVLLTLNRPDSADSKLSSKTSHSTYIYATYASNFVEIERHTFKMCLGFRTSLKAHCTSR